MKKFYTGQPVVFIHDCYVNSRLKAREGSKGIFLEYTYEQGEEYAKVLLIGRINSIKIPSQCIESY